MDLRDEVAGTQGTIWLNHFLRTGFEMFTAGGAGGYVAEKAETSAGWLFPVGDEAGELGYVDMFSDMFDAIDGGRARARRSTTATSSTRSWTPAIGSAKSRAWEPVELSSGAAAARARIGVEPEMHDGKVVIKREILPDGRQKLILKDPADRRLRRRRDRRDG